jgi:hypothetical protein
VIPHELFQPREDYYDVALLLLEKPVKFYNHIWPACLQSPLTSLDGEVLTLSGWKKSGLKSNSLIKSNLNVVANSECQNFYNGKKYEVLLPDGVVGKNLMCATNVGCEGEKKE